MSKIKLVLLSNIAASAFGSEISKEHQAQHWVAFTEDDLHFMVAGRTDGDSPEEVKAHFDNNKGFADFVSSKLPLAIKSLQCESPYIAREKLGADLTIQELGTYGK